MTEHRITYEGPAAFAVQAATLLAEADGLELTSSQPPERRDGSDTVVLALTVDGTEDAVAAALRQLRGRLPAGATVGPANEVN